ncbi:M3 family metallopeptidase [Mycoplasma buteonis]|uniref:M3 family metallopeptidase n=1 Tax=Mycoplasma buteonis TaxID=171280 RepID=UPI00055DB266|nr:M3 family metallopeptidase [Mycoplasma buteonis]
MKRKVQTTYQNLNDESKFDLESILENLTFEQLLDVLKEQADSLLKLQETKYNSAKDFKLELLGRAKMMETYNKLETYTKNCVAVSLTDGNAKLMRKQFENLWQSLKNKFGSEDADFYKNFSKIQQLLSDEELSFYKYAYQKQKLKSQHFLGLEVEEYLNKTAATKPNYYELFKTITTLGLSFKDIQTTKQKVNHASKTLLLSPNDEIRQDFYKNYYAGWLKQKEVLSQLLYAHFEQKCTEAKLRKFKYPIEQFLYLDQVNEEVLKNLYQAVKNHKHIFDDYQKYHRKFYKAKFGKTCKNWDLERELITSPINWNFNSMKEMAHIALKSLGFKYSKIIEKAFFEKWIDYEQASDKVKGAYTNINSYGINKKLILMNNTNTLRSVETLVHELGHAAHSFLVDSQENYYHSEYPILLAEVASMFNEMILYDTLMLRAASLEEHFYYLDKLIKNIQNTIFKQTMWSNYEYNLYQAVWDGKANNSYEYLRKLYWENYCEYHVNPKLENELLVPAFSVSHYYYDFYMYKYAIGQFVAIYFYSIYKHNPKNFNKHYIDDFLTLSGSDFPLKILKSVGVDLLNKDFYLPVFDYIENLVRQYQKIGKKLFLKRQTKKGEKNEKIK